MVRKQPETIYIGEPAGEDEDVTVSSHIEYGHISSYPDALISLESDSHFVNDEKNIINQANHNTHLGQAQFRTAVVLNLENKQYLFEGICEGEILEKKTGTGGFGYDPIFIPNDHYKTFGEMEPKLKMSIDHRYRAYIQINKFF